MLTALVLRHFCSPYPFIHHCPLHVGVGRSDASHPRSASYKQGTSCSVLKNSTYETHQYLSIHTCEVPCIRFIWQICKQQRPGAISPARASAHTPTYNCCAAAQQLHPHEPKKELQHPTAAVPRDPCVYLQHLYNMQYTQPKPWYSPCHLQHPCGQAHHTGSFHTRAPHQAQHVRAVL
jgi:hypothetical protein